MLYPPPPGNPIVVIVADPRAFDVGRSDAPSAASESGSYSMYNTGALHSNIGTLYVGRYIGM